MLATAAIPTPAVTVGTSPITIAPPKMPASASVLTPTVGAGKTVTSPLLQANAAVLVPAVSAGVGVSAPVMASTATMLAPDVSVIAGGTYPGASQYPSPALYPTSS
jgi:hypothetical protein